MKYPGVEFVNAVPDPTVITILPPVAFPRMSPATMMTAAPTRIGGRHVKPLPYPGTPSMMPGLIANQSPLK